MKNDRIDIIEGFKKTTTDEIAKRMIDSIPNENGNPAFVYRQRDYMQPKKDGQAQDKDSLSSSHS